MIEQNAKSITATIHGETDNNVTLNSDGLKVGNGAFELEDRNGNDVMHVDKSGVLVTNVIGTSDLIIYNTEKGSAFYNCLANMEELYTDKVSCERLYIGGKHIADYIRRQIDDYLG